MKNKLMMMLDDAQQNHEMKHEIIGKMEHYLMKIKDIDKHMYNEIMEYMNLHYSCIDEETAKNVVHMMKPYSEKFSMSDIHSISKQYDIKFDKYTPIDLYLIMNMYYNDSKNVLGDKVDHYVRMSKSFLDDEDAPNGSSEKVYNYFKFVMNMIKDEEETETHNNKYTYKK